MLLDKAAKARLTTTAVDRSPPLKQVLCAQIVLLSGAQLTMQEVARQADVSRPAVWRRQQRYGEEGVEGLLHDKTRPPGKQALLAGTVAQVLALTCSEPPGEVTHWTGRAVAQATGIVLRSMQGIWQANRLQPRRIRTLKRLHDPAFTERVEDVVGLYMDPPAQAVVLSLDEKSAIQASERTRPDLPVAPRHPAGQTHDYTRQGTTTLFAALNVLDRTVIGRCVQRHCQSEFIRFRNAVEAAVPDGKLIHAILGTCPSKPLGGRLAVRRSAMTPSVPMLPALLQAAT